jgi:hypothetical protein
MHDALSIKRLLFAFGHTIASALHDRTITFKQGDVLITGFAQAAIKEGLPPEELFRFTQEILEELDAKNRGSAVSTATRQ